MKTFKELYIINLKTYFLKLIMDRASRLMPELLDKNNHLLANQFKILEDSFETKVFNDFVNHHEEEVERFYINALELKKNINQYSFANSIKSQLINNISVNENSTIEEKIELFSQKENINKLLITHTNNMVLPKIILEQISEKEKNELTVIPKNISEMFVKLEQLPNERNTIILKENSLPYIDYLATEMKRLNSEIKVLFFNFFQDKPVITKENYGEFIAKSIWKLSDKEKLDFIKPENTYCPNTLKFFEYSRRVFLYDKKVYENLLKTECNIINKIAESLNVDTHIALICYIENSYSLREIIDKKPVIQKIIDSKREIKIKNIKNKFEKNVGFDEVIQKIIDEKNNLILAEKVDELMNSFDNINFNITNNTTRAINLDISFFKDYIKNADKLEYLQFNYSNSQLIKSFGNSRLLVLNGDFEKLTDNQIIREFFVLMQNIFGNISSLKDVNKDDIINERNISTCTKEMILNFEKNLRALNLHENFEKKDYIHNHVRKKM